MMRVKRPRLPCVTAMPFEMESSTKIETKDNHSSECEKALDNRMSNQEVIEVITIKPDFDPIHYVNSTVPYEEWWLSKKYHVLNVDRSVLTVIPEEENIVDDEGFTRVLPRKKRAHRRQASVVPTADLIADMEKAFIDLSFKVEERRSSKRRNEKETRSRNYRARAKRMKPHASYVGDDINAILSHLQNLKIPDGLCTDAESKAWFSHFENLVILAHLVYKANDLSSVCAAICAYIKMNTRRSLTLDLFKIIDELMGIETPEEGPAHYVPPLFPEDPRDADGTVPEDMEPHAWNGRKILDNWKLFRANPIFTKISYLISAAMSLVACEITEVEWSPFGLKLISIQAMKQQVDAISFMDAVLETFIWCCETGWQVFKQRSLMPILYGDQQMQDFNIDCDFVIANADAALAGNISVQDFEHKVDKVLSRISELKLVQKDGPTAMWLQSRYSSVVEIKHKLIAKHRNTELRFAPIGWALTGPTGVGKSSLSKQTMVISLLSMGFSTDAARIITKDQFDKYDSTMTSDIEGVYFDDVGNGKPAFEVSSPTDVLIKYFNNVSAQAVKAELNQKGVVFVNFKCGVLTSNQKDFNVRHYSDCPESILRRFYCVRVEVAPKYRKKGSSLLDTQHPDLINNPSLVKSLWILKIEECIPFTNKKGQSSYKFETLSYRDDEGKFVVCDAMTLTEYLQTVVYLSKKHKQAQDRLLTSNTEFNKMEFCGRCCLPTELCKCPPEIEKDSPPEKMEPHAFSEITSSLESIVISSAKKSIVRYIRSWIAPVVWANWVSGFKPISAYATRQLSKEFASALDEVLTPYLIAMTPEWAFNSRVFQRCVHLWRGSAATRDFSKHASLVTLIMGMCTAGGVFGKGKMKRASQIGVLINLVAYYVLFAQRRARIEAIKDEYIRRRDALPQHWKALRESKVAQGTVLMASLVVGMKLFRMWSNSMIKPQSDEEKEFIQKKDDSPGWFGHMLNKIGVAPKASSPNSVDEHLVQTLLKSNLYWGRFEREDKAYQCNIFFPRKSVAMFPRHMFYENMDEEKGKLLKDMKITVMRHDGPGGKFTFKTHYDFAVSHPELDLVMVYVPNCPDLKDKSKFFPDEVPSSTTLVNFIGRNCDGAFQEKVVARCGYKGGHAYALKMPACQYNSKFAKKGACMSVLTSLGANPCLFAFHIGGSGTVGRGMHVSSKDYEYMIEELEKKPGVYLSSLSGDIPTEQYGRTVIESESVHPHAMTAKLDLEAYIDVLGSVRLRTQQKSVVGPSILSEHVTEVCGVPNKWGKPKLLPNWKAYNATLEHIVSPSDMFSPPLLEKARQDWLKPLLEKMDKYKMVEDFRPLTSRESILGVHGKRFLEPLKMTTSMGFPVFGPKTKHFEEIRDGEVLIDRLPHSEVQEEMDRLIECWERGVRGYPVVSATLKDEPTDVSSEKVRVFQAGGVALTILMRKYFLPIARFLGVYPLISESAVGVNAFSPEWEEMMGHATKYAKDDRMLAWDYSKYDVRMNSQVTRAVFACFIELAERGGYDAHSLKIMKMMVCDIVHPLMDYNGTMIMVYNINTSGNPLTVVINGCAGSLYVRTGFFHVYPHVEDFREKVGALTYGDDFIGSVAPGFRSFNNRSYQEFLAHHDIKITPPDKKSEMSDFLPRDEVDFLKRKSNFIPEIGCEIGALDEDSIFKSLHQNLKSRTETKEQVAISCIEGAMHEWFAHGREKYNLRQRQLEEVCRRIGMPIPAVYASYDERVQHWKEKYISQSSEESSENSI